jgi:hypothetical protein
MARGDPIADFAKDLQPTTPKAGWSYLWNGASHALGKAADYTALLPVPTNNNDFFGNKVYYSPNGSASLPGPNPAGDLFFGVEVQMGQPGGHPGQATSDAPDGLEHFAIAAFTLSSGGPTSIGNGLLASVNPSPTSDGIDLRVFVNDTDTGFTLDVANDNSKPFSLTLGTLHAGDTIYVAVGPRATDSFDAFALSYQIDQPTTAVPEPCSLTLGSLGVLGMLGVGWRRWAGGWMMG